MVTVPGRIPEERMLLFSSATMTSQRFIIDRSASCEVVAGIISRVPCESLIVTALWRLLPICSSGFVVCKTLNHSTSIRRMPRVISRAASFCRASGSGVSPGAVVIEDCFGEAGERKEKQGEHHHHSEKRNMPGRRSWGWASHQSETHNTRRHVHGCLECYRAIYHSTALWCEFLLGEGRGRGNYPLP